MASLEESVHLLTGALQCPVCWNFCSPPIFICNIGHTICSKCHSSVKQCPTCRGSMSNNGRNWLAEEVSEKFRAPCKNVAKGCKEMLPLAEKRDHENKNCPAGRNCPIINLIPNSDVYDTCKWDGDFSEMWTHVENDHPNISTYTNENGLIAINSGVFFEQILMSIDGRVFRFVGMTAANGDDARSRVFIHVQHMGSGPDSDDYHVKLFTSGNGYSLKAKASPVTEPLPLKGMIKELVASCSYYEFVHNLIPCANKDGKIVMAINISKNAEVITLL